MAPDAQTFPAVKECDLRGRYPGEIDEALLALVSRNLGDAVRGARFPGLTHGTIVVGGDGRCSTASLRDALLSGLRERGASIIDLPAAVPTPVVYWAKHRLRAQACAIVTASHSPPDWNGLKVMNGPLPPLPEEISALVAPLATPAAPPPPGSVERWDGVVEDYLADRAAAFAERRLEGLAVVVDPGGGCQSGIASGLFHRLGAATGAIHDRLDGTFSQRHPDSAVPRHLAALCRAVTEQRADVGVAFDGDGDRLAIVDDRGRPASAEQVAMLLLQGPLAVPPGAPVVLDIKTSLHVEEAARSAGAAPIRCRSGHAFMKRAVITRGAVLGAEVTGHLFLGALAGMDDPLHTALLLCAWLRRSGRALSAWIDGLPRLSVSPDVRLRMEPARIDALLEACATRFRGCEVERTDGVRLVWPEGWLLARRSVTEQACTLRFEGRGEADLASVVGRFVEAFPDLRDAVAAASH